MIDDEDDVAEPEVIKGDFFVVLFAGLMTILMTFFIVLCSMSTSSTAKLEQVQQSLDNSFISLGIVKSSDILWFINNFAQISKKLGFSKQSEVGETTKGARTKLGFFEKERERKFKKISNLVIHSSMSIKTDKDEITLTLPSNVFFEEDDYVLTAKGEETLEGIQELVASGVEAFLAFSKKNSFGKSKEPEKKPVKEAKSPTKSDEYDILIVSYVKDEKVKGDYSALELCVRRANQISRFFRKHGIPAKHLKIKALGALRHRKKAILRDKIDLIIA